MLCIVCIGVKGEGVKGGETIKTKFLLACVESVPVRRALLHSGRTQIGTRVKNARERLLRRLDSHSLGLRHSFEFGVVIEPKGLLKQAFLGPLCSISSFLSASDLTVGPEFEELYRS